MTKAKLKKINKMIRLHLEGWSNEKIAKHFKCSRQNVWNFIHDHPMYIKRKQRTYTFVKKHDK